jgi:hypothetical protein
MEPADTVKTREICFFTLPPGQAVQALALLDRMEHLEARLTDRDACIAVSYNIFHHTLEGLEHGLASLGFHLDNSLLQKLRRAVIHYSEQVQRENLRWPEREQLAREAFIRAYEQHPHGDFDATPEEWREYR